MTARVNIHGQNLQYGSPEHLQEVFQDLIIHLPQGWDRVKPTARQGVAVEFRGSLSGLGADSWANHWDARHETTFNERTGITQIVFTAKGR